MDYFDKKFGQHLTLKLWLFILLFCGFAPVYSAEISFIKNDSYILLKGAIVKGDFERFLNATLEGGIRVNYIYLASNGGDVFEAMKIGRFIKRIGYSTRSPHLIFYPPRYGDLAGITPGCAEDVPVTKEECTCLSACALIYLAGAERSGGYLGVHRAFLNHSDLKELSFEESKKVGKTIARSVNKYLVDMNSPISLIDKINSKSSQEIEILDKNYVDEYLMGISLEYEEWLISKCGDRNEYLDDLITDEGYKKYDSLTDDRYRCYSENIEMQSEKVFYDSVTNALKYVETKYIPYRSLLAYISKVDHFQIIDLIGKINVEAIDMMSLVGVGQATSKPYKNIMIEFNNSIILGFKVNGEVYQAELAFNSSSGELRNYEGYFLDGFSNQSKPRDFIMKYGKPFKKGCYPSGNCFVVFELEAADLEVLFNKDMQLTRLTVNKSGYWRSLGK